MKIGVAIPCYIGHINKLFDLLNSIEKQTILPDKVVVSCSSTKELHIQTNYSFPVSIIITPDKKNAAENRNIAASNLLDMDYITFFDADDLMHPERIEILHKVINDYQTEFIAHNFYLDNEIEFPNLPHIDIAHLELRQNQLIPAPSGCITHIDYYDDFIYRIHHSQVTIKTNLFHKTKFPEEAEFYAREDSVFCNRCLQDANVKNTYIINKLSYYRQSGTMDLYNNE